VDAEPKRKSKRKGEVASGEQPASTKRRKTVPKRKLKPKSDVAATETPGPTGQEGLESSERTTENSPTAGKKDPSDDTANTKVRVSSGDERIKDLERHLSPFFAVSRR
jgi:hypothetical protein